GIYAGVVGENDTTNSFVQVTFRRSGGSVIFVGLTTLVIPSPKHTAEWLAFATNGYTKSFTNFNLITTVAYNHVFETWGSPYAGAFTITHNAQLSTTNFVYQFELFGLASDATPMVYDAFDYWYPSRLYTVEFESRPATRSPFVDAPQFDREPLPPGYQGLALAELLTNLPPAVSSVSLPNSATTYTNLDQSPELRRHPILDQLVSDMQNDPIALARYVHNEVKLTDAIDLNETGNFSEISVNLGGVSRGALGTFLEGQGSPTEQCALLVYLLRQARVPAVFCYPPRNGLKLIDSQLSRLLHLQLSGAVDDGGNLWTTNSLIAANYPWVAAYIGTNWVHLFPWLKDTEIVEGLPLYDYMPAGFENGFKWLREFALGNTNILNLATDDDTPLALFPKFISNALSNSAPGISIDDIGVRWVDRPKAYARWQDFPRPFVVPLTNVALDTLTSSAITNVFPGLTNIFDTVSVEVTSVANPTRKVTSGELRLADIHNRRFIVRHEKTAANAHRLILNLAAFRPNATGSTNFAVGDWLVNTQQISTNLVGTDDELAMKLVYKRHRSLPQSIATNPPSFWTSYPGLTATYVVDNQLVIRKGDLAAICFSAGCVSRAMLNVHAQELWNMERELALNTNAPVDVNLFQGGTAYLMGMAYYENISRFDAMNQQLHKTPVISRYAHGLSRLIAKRNAMDNLPNSGDVILVQPAVDMPFSETVLVGNRTLHPDSGDERFLAAMSYMALSMAHGSSEEHQIINRFFRQGDAISTIKLLQQTKIKNYSPGVFTINAQNYTAQGNTTVRGTLLRNHDTEMWKAITNFVRQAGVSNYTLAYVTPGAITNNTGSYEGMGALLWSPNIGRAALISPNMSGGSGEREPDETFTSVNAVNYSLQTYPNGDYAISTTPVSTGNRTLAPPTVAFYDQTTVINNAGSDYYYVSPEQSLISRQMADAGLVNLSGGTASQSFGQASQAEDERGFWGWVQNTAQQVGGTVADPVGVVSGEFCHDEIDLNLPGPMPLQLRRNYSSLNLSENQFGHGWKINYAPFLSLSTDTNLIYSAEMDGAVLAYEKQSGTNLWLVAPVRNPLLDNYSKSGIGSAANRLRQRITRTSGGGKDTYTLHGSDGSTRIYQTAPFAGFSALKPYLLTWQDNRSNFHSFEYGTNSAQPGFAQVRRILSSSGNLLGLHYDIYGHIIEAYTQDGRRVIYDYDQFGDLVAVTRQDATAIQFEYERKTQSVTNGSTVTQEPYSTHLLIKEFKPDGRLLVNQYDAQRRVTNQLATVGPDLRLLRNATFAYTNNFNLTNSSTTGITGSTTVYDIFNNPTTYRYSGGLITNIVDPVSVSASQIWWQTNEIGQVGYYPRSLKRSIDRRGLVTDFFYDSNGNVVSNIVSGDLTGYGTNSQALSTATYDTNNLPLIVIDPTGNKIQRIYHNAFPWLPEQIIRLSGATTVSTTLLVYYNVTNTVTNGNLITTNTAQGLLQRETRAYASAEGATNTWTHDGRGFPLSHTRSTGTTDPDVTVFFTHNGRGELIERRDAANRVQRFTFDGLGRPQSREVFDENGNRVAWDLTYYNENGEVTWTDGPRYNPEDYVWRDYDGAGRPTQEIRWKSESLLDGTGVQAASDDELYATTFQEWDGFGNLKRVVNARGYVTTNRYDAIGRLIESRQLSSSGSILAANGFAYEPGNQIRFQTNALGGVTETRYTATGQPNFRSQPDGSTNAWRYYLDGRLESEVQRNGAYWKTGYDDANRRTTRTFFSASGVPLATNVSEFDRRGNLVRHTDAEGFTSTNLFDGLDRLKLAAGPAIVSITPTNVPGPGGPQTNIVQQVVTNFYDAAGRASTNINALGEKTITLFDALGRVFRSEVRDGANALVRETSTAYRTDHHGLTITNGSGSTAIVATGFTDNQGRPVLDVGFPGGGVREYTRTQYDAMGNRFDISRRVATNTSLSVELSYYYAEFDELNRPFAETRQDGATLFSYDAMGNITNRVMPSVLIWRGRYNNAGQILEEYNVGTGNAATRTNTYAYFSSSSPFAGLLQARAEGRGVICTYGYDDWLRQTTNTHSGALAEQNVKTVSSYNVRGLLTNAVETFASGSNPTTVVRRGYDAYGLLSSETISIGGTSFGGASATWNSTGRRNALGLGTFGFSYQWRADGTLSGVAGPTGGGTYAYDTAGFLTNRTVGSRISGITSRDGMGRTLTADTKIGGVSKLAEAVAWSGDGLVTAHTLARPDFTNSQSYFYQTFSRRLTEERLNINGSARWTNKFTYDGGSIGGAGVLTRNTESATTAGIWSGARDAFQRVSSETNALVRRPAYGRINGLATVSLQLDGKVMPVTLIGTQAMQWRATLEMAPGTHQLQAFAKHPSGLFTTNAVAWFTNNAANEIVS
ncbi:MAG TPA: DUF6531 domain-containing protein, partial [Candidatus Acidoferrum sp.]|nr:DUF6531 domain-containing protein [Candidatus Acidoferrum sp.]